MMLTQRQQQALTFIERTIAETGRSPTFLEISTGLGFKSKSTAFYIVERLIERGKLRKLPYRDNALELVDPELETLRKRLDEITRRLDRAESIIYFAYKRELLDDIALAAFTRDIYRIVDDLAQAEASDDMRVPA